MAVRFRSARFVQSRIAVQDPPGSNSEKNNDAAGIYAGRHHYYHKQERLTGGEIKALHMNAIPCNERKSV